MLMIKKEKQARNEKKKINHAEPKKRKEKPRRFSSSKGISTLKCKIINPISSCAWRREGGKLSKSIMVWHALIHRISRNKYRRPAMKLKWRLENIIGADNLNSQNASPLSVCAA
jgi:hypothetical protein